MEVVQQFLEYRRNGEGDSAYSLLAEGVSISCPWGGVYEGERAHQLLLAEHEFVKKGYLDPVKIEQIDENTFQRKYKFNTGLCEPGNFGFKYFNILKTWREIYFVKEGKIILMTTEKQLPYKTFRSLLNL